MIGFFMDGDERSMRRLIAFWAMSLLTIVIFSIIFGVNIDIQVILVLGGIAGTGTAVSAIKNKSIGDSK